MACPVCGSHSPCAHAQQRAIVLIGPEASDPAQQKAAEAVAASPQAAVSVAAGEIMDRSNTNIWREEVISRVQQHRARRRRRGDASSMEFDFQAGTELSAGPAIGGEAARPRANARSEQPKIIEFPRPQSYFARIEPQRREEDELAEPVIESPRILEAQEPPAEQMNLLPAFADIQLEAQERRGSQDLELPPQAAPLAQRTFAGLV